MINLSIISKRNGFSLPSEYSFRDMTKSLVKEAIVKIANVHRKGLKKDILVFAGRRSGSTWLMDLLYSQPKMKFCAEPLYLGRWNS